VSTKSLTEQRIFQLLKRRWPWPGYIVLPQVPSATGAACRRYADALVISAYPSRGIYATGVEIKVSRSDWKAELAQPAKAEPVLKYCLYWYVAAPKGLIDPGEVPEQWGLIDCSSHGTRIAKRAPKLSPAKPTWEFVAGVARRLAEQVITREEHDRLLQEERDKCAKDAEKAMQLYLVESRLRDLQETVDTFERASGVKIADQWDVGPIGEAVAVVLKARRRGGYGETIDRVARTLRRIAASLQALKPELQQVDADDGRAQ